MRVTTAPRDDLLRCKRITSPCKGVLTVCSQVHLLAIFILFFYRSGGLCTHKRASVQWMEKQLARGPSLCSWWMRRGTSTRGPTPALPTTCKEANQCPQMSKCCPSPHSRNRHQSGSEGEYGGLVKCCVTVCCALLRNKIKCSETSFKLF